MSHSGMSDPLGVDGLTMRMTSQHAAASDVTCPPLLFQLRGDVITGLHNTPAICSGKYKG